MRGLEVQLNGNKLCHAGIDQEGVLNAIVNVIGKSQEGYDMNIRVGGLEGDQFVIWTTTDLAVGDEIKIRILESPSIDPPALRRPNKPSTQV